MLGDPKNYYSLLAKKHPDHLPCPTQIELQLVSQNQQIDKKNQEQAALLFSVPDFIGDFCKAITSCF